MVNYSLDPLDVVFSALANPTRRAILERLLAGEATIGEVAEPFDSSLPAISKHIRVLEQARLVKRRKDARSHYLSLAASPIGEAVQWLERYRSFWDSQFNSLETYLKKDVDHEHRKSC